MRPDPPTPTEAADQNALFDWLAVTYVTHHTMGRICLRDYAFAVPNGAFLAGDVATRARQMSHLKRAGVTPGVPDLMLALPTGKYHGLFIEMKRFNAGRTTPEQLGWINRLSSCGYRAVVAHGLDAAVKHIRAYCAA